MTAARVETIPVLGHWLADVFRGGPAVGAGTLVRLAALHGLLLPWLAFAGLVLARRLGREGRGA
jgi:quinol-cytochrome oxidoreductase complex cytochrome b subunit